MLTQRERTLLERYADLVEQWHDRVDLVSPGDIARFWERHVEDALNLVPLLRQQRARTAVDVGSGVGIPGIPLAIVEPSIRWRLLEPRRRRAAFLEVVVRELDLECDVVTLSAEQAASRPEYAGAHDVAVARALASPARAFRLLLPLVAPTGVAAVMLGEQAAPPEGSEMWEGRVAIMRPTEGGRDELG